MKAILLIGLLVVGLAMIVPTDAPAQTSCQPNLLGGMNCSGSGGTWTTQPNLFGGQDVRNNETGQSWQTRPNALGGYDINSRDDSQSNRRSDPFAGPTCRTTVLGRKTVLGLACD